jgi:tyrosyl-tRNA synthetase
MMMGPQEQRELLRSGVVDIIPEPQLIEKLAQGRPLRVKFGADPSMPDLHLGHVVVLRKLRQLQDLGHQVVFLIGDFTGMIGDPTGRSDTRKALSREQVRENAKSYEDQVFHVLDRSRTEIRFNSEWMDRMSASDLVQLGASYTVARMLEREDFSNRFSQHRPIGIHEFLYPLIQGYDSVVLGADIEVGGTDQRFNLLVGRELQRDGGMDPQVVITLPLLEGTDGSAKMSKSMGNAIGITEPPQEMFGKLMSISDELMQRYFELLAPDDWRQVGPELHSGRLHPMAAKKRLARRIVADFHGGPASEFAQGEFEQRFQGRALPSELPEFVWGGMRPVELNLPNLLRECGLVGSAAEGRRLVAQRAVRIDGERIEEILCALPPTTSRLVLQVGSRRAIAVIFPEKSS